MFYAMHFSEDSDLALRIFRKRPVLQALSRIFRGLHFSFPRGHLTLTALLIVTWDVFIAARFSNSGR